MKLPSLLFLFFSAFFIISIMIYSSYVLWFDVDMISEKNVKKEVNNDQFNELIEWGNRAMRFPDSVEEYNINNSPGIKVAILDSGINLRDKTLVPYIKESYNCLANTNCVMDKKMKDEYGHGTQIAKIISTGIPLSVRIIPIQIIDNNGNANIRSFVNGMNLAIEKQVNIINLSLQIDENIDAVYNVIKKAYDHNIVVVASSGNNGENHLSFPARYEEVISVGSINQRFQRSEFSQYGEGLDFSGPGEFTDDDMERITGTSFATAFVTKAIALLSLKHDSITHTQLHKKLKNSAKDLNRPGFDNYTGYGIINVQTLLQR